MNTAAAEPKSVLLGQLYELFRRRGYDGVSIGDISAETGLGRSSLYHHFPGGKAQMAADVLAYARAAMEEAFFAPLASEAPLLERVTAMLAAVDRAYASGAQPCILASLLSASEDGPISSGLTRLLQDWVDAIAASLERGGAPPEEAKRRALKALALIQGGLVLARGLKDRSAFTEALAAAADALGGSCSAPWNGGAAG
jgi:AcrR family transcriptional regulator